MEEVRNFKLDYGVPGARLSFFQSIVHANDPKRMYSADESSVLDGSPSTHTD